MHININKLFYVISDKQAWTDCDNSWKQLKFDIIRILNCLSNIKNNSKKIKIKSLGNITVSSTNHS